MTPDFALRSLTYSSIDMRYLSEQELVEEGVLTRKAQTHELEVAML